MQRIFRLPAWTGTAFLAFVAAALPFDLATLEHSENQLKFQGMSAEEQARLRQNARYFLALPSDRRERVVKLDHDLHKLAQARRENLEKVLSKYVQWLEQLPAEDRAKIQSASDTKAKLEIIKQLRAEQWLKQQPAVVRADIAKLSAEQQAARIRQHRDEEGSRRFDWVIARRFWNDLSAEKPLPARLDDFSGREFGDLANYVKEYLQVFLSNEDKARLKEAEGKWPLYPRTLVELADAHPLALPGPRGPKHLMELPNEVRKKLTKSKKDFLTMASIRLMEGRWPNFAVGITHLAKSRRGKQGQGIIFPFELWPYDARGLSPRMKQFLEKDLRPVLDDDEAARLRKVEIAGKWPDFPETIQRLARKHDLVAPWQSLPGPEEYWDRFRMKPRASANK